VGGIGSAISTRNTVERDIATPSPDNTAAPARPASVIASCPTVVVSRRVRRA
jgi:hypothetical protein